MKVAVASSGLGHVARGIETWAGETARGLQAAGVDVTLFAGAPCPAAPSVSVRVLSCLRRRRRAARVLSAMSPPFLWRWGLKSAYGWEQLSFWRQLSPVLRNEGFDILHVQDPMLARWALRARRRGASRTREILAHGTEESADFLAPFDFVQHLAPWHLEQMRAQVEDGGCCRPHWTAIPNFVDTDLYHPTDAAGTQRARRRFDLPEEAAVIGVVAAVKKHHKRIDYLIREFAEAFPSPGATPDTRHPLLCIAGSRQDDTDQLVALADDLVPGRARFLLDVPQSQMPPLYRAFDLFVLTSLFEMMPISLLEAMASGLAVVTHAHPVLQWITGTSLDRGAGITVDMGRSGALASFLRALEPSRLVEHGDRARRRAEQEFARAAVIRRYIGYYRQVLEASV